MDYINKIELKGIVGAIKKSENCIFAYLCVESIIKNTSIPVIKTEWVNLRIDPNLPNVDKIKSTEPLHIKGHISMSTYVDKYDNDVKILIVIVEEIL